MWFQLLAPRRVQYTLLIIFGTFSQSFLLYRVHEPDGHSLSRQYTPISPLDQKGSFDVMIKVYITGYSVLQDYELLVSVPDSLPNGGGSLVPRLTVHISCKTPKHLKNEYGADLST